MKRYSGLHDKLCTIENIEVADDNARKNKNKKYGINKHDKNRQYEVEIKLYFILYIDLIIFLLILKLLNMIGIFILKIEKKILNLKYNILWLKINLKMILLELYAV
nr:MAG: MatK/TrnK amino terminal region [Bacteriophage sp.]